MSNVARDNSFFGGLLGTKTAAPFGKMKLKLYSNLFVFLFNGMTKDGLGLGCPQSRKE